MEVDESAANATDNLTVGEVNVTEVEATGRGHRQRKERQIGDDIIVAVFLHSLLRLPRVSSRAPELR